METPRVLCRAASPPRTSRTAQAAKKEIRKAPRRQSGRPCEEVPSQLFVSYNWALAQDHVWVYFGPTPQRGARPGTVRATPMRIQPVTTKRIMWIGEVGVNG